MNYRRCNHLRLRRGDVVDHSEYGDCSIVYRRHPQRLGYAMAHLVPERSYTARALRDTART